MLACIVGGFMATKTEIRDRVLRFFRAKFKFVELKTDMRSDLLLVTKQVFDIGVALALELGCNPSTTQIRLCKSVGDLADLLARTQYRAKIHDIV